MPEATRSRSASGPASTSTAIEARERVTEHDVAAFVDVVQERVGQPAGAWVHYGLTSSDVVDTALVAASSSRAADLLVGARGRARRGDHEAGARVPRHPDGRPHPRHPRRADDVRREAGALGAAGPPRPRAAAPGPRRRSPSASSRRGGHVLERRSRRRAVRLRALGLTPVPATQVLARDRHAELLYACARSARASSSSRSRSAISSAPRCARSRSRSAPGSRRAPRRCRTSATRSRASSLRARPRAARQPRRRARERRAVARARHLALVGRAHHPPRLAACSRTTCS